MKLSDIEQKIFDRLFDKFKHIYPPHFPNVTVDGGKREKHGVGLYSLETNSVVFILQLCTNKTCSAKISNVKYHLENKNVIESFIFNYENGEWLKFTHLGTNEVSSYSELLETDLRELLSDIVHS